MRFGKEGHFQMYVSKVGSFEMCEHQVGSFQIDVAEVKIPMAAFLTLTVFVTAPLNNSQNNGDVHGYLLKPFRANSVSPKFLRTALRPASLQPEEIRAFRKPSHNCCIPHTFTNECGQDLHDCQIVLGAFS